MWQWVHRFGSPKWFYEQSGRWLPWLWAATISLLVVGIIWGLGFAPVDYKQGESYRIIYIHVPSALLAMAGYCIMAIAAAVGMIWQIKMGFWVMKSAAPIGAVLTLIALVTGALWGKPTWGTYWVWDARLTSMLILFFLYLGLIALHDAFPNEDTANKATAVLSLVGIVLVVIIYGSVHWWNTLHQGATIKFTGKSSIDPSMKYPLITMICAFYLFYATVLMSFVRVEVLQRQRRTRWVQELLLGGQR